MMPCGGVNFRAHVNFDYLEGALAEVGILHVGAGAWKLHRDRPFSESPSRPQKLLELPWAKDHATAERQLGRPQALKKEGLTGQNLITMMVRRKPLHSKPDLP